MNSGCHTNQSLGLQQRAEIESKVTFSRKRIRCLSTILEPDRVSGWVILLRNFSIPCLIISNIIVFSNLSSSPTTEDTRWDSRCWREWEEWCSHSNRWATEECSQCSKEASRDNRFFHYSFRISNTMVVTLCFFIDFLPIVCTLLNEWSQRVKVVR